MTLYEIEFEYKLPDGGYIRIDADDVDQAEDKAEVTIKTLYPNATNIEIVGVKEVQS